MSLLEVKPEPVEGVVKVEKRAQEEAMDSTTPAGKKRKTEARRETCELGGEAGDILVSKIVGPAEASRRAFDAAKEKGEVIDVEEWCSSRCGGAGAAPDVFSPETCSAEVLVKAEALCHEGKFSVRSSSFNFKSTEICGH